MIVRKHDKIEHVQDQRLLPRYYEDILYQDPDFDNDDAVKVEELLL